MRSADPRWQLLPEHGRAYWKRVRSAHRVTDAIAEAAPE